MSMDAHSQTSPSHDWFLRFNIRFYRLKSLFRQRWWILALMVSLCLLYEAVVIITKPVEYQSSGRLMLSEKINIPEATRFVEDNYNFAGTQLLILESNEVYERAKRRLALQRPDLNGSIEISVNMVPRTSIFTVTGVGTHAEYTELFVNALMEEFIAYKREKRRDNTDTTMGQISEELVRLRKELDQNESALHDFIEKNNMAFWDEQAKTAARYLSVLKNQEANLTNELRSLENLTSEQLLARTQAKVAADRDSAPEAPLARNLTDQYVNKSQELIQKKADVELMSKVWKPKHPRLLALQEDIRSIELLLQVIREQNKESTNSRIVALKAEYESVLSAIKTWEARVLEASRKDAEYQHLMGAAQRTQSLYEKLLMSMQNVDLSKSVNQEMLQIMQRASTAMQLPAGTLKHLGIGLFVGLLLGSGILLLMDRADDRFSSASEVIEKFPEPILAQIPEVSDDLQESRHLPLLQPKDGRYTFSESFRSLRSSLVFLPDQKDLRLLLVTSAIPGEGKSTISSNLAITLALAGARVLLVDADLRRGDIGYLFGLEENVGLSNVLRGEIQWRDAVQQTAYPLLSLLPRGPVTNQSGELLLIPILETLLQEFRNSFDLTIFNTSPIMATDDTPTLAPHFDGALMVMRANYTGGKVVHNSLNALYQRQVNVLGLVVNCISTGTPDYYYYRYPKYYRAEA